MSLVLRKLLSVPQRLAGRQNRDSMNRIGGLADRGNNSMARLMSGDCSSFLR